MVSSWVTSVFDFLPADCIKATFKHIGFTSEGVSAPLTLYPSTTFSYVQQSHISNDSEKDNIGIQSEGYDWNVDILVLFSVFPCKF